MIDSRFFIIQDAILDIINEEWDESFQEEYNILGWKILHTYEDRDLVEIKIFFKDEESLDKYMKDFDLEE